MTVIAVDGLTVTYPGTSRPAVKDVSLQLEAGNTLAVVGESGSGKTTLAVAIGGLLNPRVDWSADRFEFKGSDMLGMGFREWREVRRKELAFVFQSPANSWNETRTLRAQLQDALDASGVSDGMDSLVDLLRRVGMEEPEKRLDDFPHQMSGGMLQRVSIAVALVHEPSLVIADEPTSALDSTVQAEILRILNELRTEVNLAMLIISHDLSVVERVADDIMVLYGGKVVEQGARSDILSAPIHPYTRGLMDSVPQLDGTPKEPIPSMRSGGLPDVGCPFSPRCPFAVDSCFEADPELVPFGDVLVACPPATAAARAAVS